MKISKIASAVLLLSIFAAGNAALTAERNVPNSGSQPSRGQMLLEKAAQDQKYAFLVFIKNDDAASQAMFQTAKAELSKQPGKALLGAVPVSSEAEQPIVSQFDLARAPMPFLLVVAPNGAITGTFGKKVAPNQIAASFVSPTMAHCMKSLQQGKSVLICVHSTPAVTFPRGVLDLQRDPEFKNRISVTSVNAADPAEASFLETIELTPEELNGTTTVFLAPPGALVGKFSAVTSKGELLAALHSAGKCCNDENCKHNHGPHQGGPAAQQNTRQATQGSNRTRN